MHPGSQRLNINLSLILHKAVKSRYEYYNRIHCILPISNQAKRTMRNTFLVGSSSSSFTQNKSSVKDQKIVISLK